MARPPPPEIQTFKRRAPWSPKAPTIDFEDVADRAREVCGKGLARVTLQPRVRRAEVITLHFGDGSTMRVTNQSYRDPDAVRQTVLDWCASVERAKKEKQAIALAAEMQPVIDDYRAKQQG